MILKSSSTIDASTDQHFEMCFHLNGIYLSLLLLLRNVGRPGIICVIEM